MNIINPNLPQISQNTIQKDNSQNKQNIQAGGSSFISAMKDVAYSFFRPVKGSNDSNEINFKKPDETKEKSKKTSKNANDLIAEIEAFERRMKQRKGR